MDEADSKESDTNQDMESDQDKDTTEKKNDWLKMILWGIIFFS